MTTTLMTEALLDRPNESGFQPPSNESAHTQAADIWIARGLIVAFCIGLAAWTWGHWGDFQIDNGRELYVPAEILKGKMLYRDLWYMYGPLAPYLKAILFRVFGVQLTVLYGFGLALTMGTALLTFEVGRFFRLGAVGSAVAPIFFLTESFYPFIRNFVFPYSYAASLGAFLGMGCLYFVLRHASSKSAYDFGLASLLASLSLLTKQEFGAACLALLGFEIAACYWSRRSLKELFRNVSIGVAGLLPAVAGYGWFVWKLSAKFIFFDNWISTPGTYFMRTFGKITIPDQGLRFIPFELLMAAVGIIWVLDVWLLFAYLAARAIKRMRLTSGLPVAFVAVAVLAPFWISALAVALLHPTEVISQGTPMTTVLLTAVQSACPKGIFFVAVFFILHALWKLWKAPANELFVQEGALGIYASLVAVRQMMMLRPKVTDCAVFFNGPTFLVFIILIHGLICWGCRTLDAQRGRIVAASMLATEAIMVVLLFYPMPQVLSTPLRTDNGTFYTRPDVAELFPQIISFMKSHTQNGKDILVLPEPPSLYTFAGMEAPSRWYSLVPGYVAPEQEQQYIDELASNHVRYILIANRELFEYRVNGFAYGGYNTSIYSWIMQHFEKVGQFGPKAGAKFPPYTMWVYERKDLARQE